MPSFFQVLGMPGPIRVPEARLSENHLCFLVVHLQFLSGEAYHLRRSPKKGSFALSYPLSPGQVDAID